MTVVSVVIPTRDRRDLLRLAVVSVLSQQDVDVEVIVVDDASTDDVAGMVSSLTDRRVRVVRQTPSGGVSAARNRGIAETNGEWVAFLDDDDLWAPQKLALQLEAATRSSRTWVYTGDVNVDDDLRVLTASAPPTPAQVMERLPRYNPVPSGASNVLVRADALAEAGPFDPGLKRTEDWDMWIRVARTGAPAFVPRPLVAYRFHSANLATETTAIIEEADRLAARHGIPVDRAAMQRRAAWISLRANDRRRAIRHYARAVAMGDVRSAARAAVALVHPAVGSNRLFALLPQSPADDARRREAQEWLDDLSRLEAATPSPP
jgi:glycosyltransferase involved in cell wall biosynthesis